MYFIWLIVCFGIVSLFAFVAYGLDKRKAKKGRWRTKESVLLLFGFLGGSVGALLGMSVFRHKTRHWYFWLVNILGLAWQAGLVYWVLTVLDL